MFFSALLFIKEKIKYLRIPMSIKMMFVGKYYMYRK